MTLARGRRELHKSNETLAVEMGFSLQTIQHYVEKIDGREPWTEYDVRTFGQDTINEYTPIPYKPTAADKQTSLLDEVEKNIGPMLDNAMSLLMAALERLTNEQVRSLYMELKAEIMRRFDDKRIG